MTKTELKYAAQDELLAGMANAILGEREYGANEEKIEEMERQAKRVMKFLGVSSFPGLGSA